MRSAAAARSEGRVPATYENVTLPEEFGPVSHYVDEALMKQYAFCQDDYSPWRGGPVGPDEPLFAHAASMANDLQAMYYCKYDRTSVRRLHAQEELWFHQPVACGETMALSGSFTDKFEKRGYGYVVAESVALSSNGTECVRHRAVQIMRLSGGRFRRGAGQVVGQERDE